MFQTDRFLNANVLPNLPSLPLKVRGIVGDVVVSCFLQTAAKESAQSDVTHNQPLNLQIGQVFSTTDM